MSIECAQLPCGLVPDTRLRARAGNTTQDCRNAIYFVGGLAKSMSIRRQRAHSPRVITLVLVGG